jgi:hypothetical protein
MFVNIKIISLSLCSVYFFGKIMIITMQTKTNKQELSEERGDINEHADVYMSGVRCER